MPCRYMTCRLELNQGSMTKKEEENECWDKQTLIPLGYLLMTCIILKGSLVWSCSFWHGHVHKRQAIEL